jgi:predicted DNA-binding ribbon-helix-helix protein
MKSSIVKRSIGVAGHRTTVSLEDAFWKTFKEIADGRHMTLSELVAAIDSKRQHGNPSSANPTLQHLQICPCAAAEAN